jgi:uncharacterized protein YjaZ
MNINVLDTEAAYRRILAAPDAATREAIYRQEIAVPFAGLAKIFGSDDVLASFDQWQMSLSLFEGEERARTAALVDTLAVHNAWEQFAQAMQDGKAAFSAYAERIPLETIQAALLVGGLIGDHGYTGFGGIPGYVMTVYGEANDYTLPRIKGTTVHELHHNVLSVAMPINFMDVTLGYYMIMEGLAESFSAELYSEDVVGYYVTEFSGTEIYEAKRIIGGALETRGFNAVRSYIFGDTLMRPEFGGLPKSGVPAYAGYAIGYRVVQQYLKRTGKTVVEATFVRADKIIAESGYFSA